MTLSRWQPYQQKRLAEERQLLRSTMPGFDIRQPLGDTHVAGEWVSNAGYLYEVRIYLPRGYPDECPSTYVVSPSPLLDHRGKPVVKWGDSHMGHTWKSDRRGWVKLCTFRPANWDASNSLVQIARKSLLWIVAYEQHVRQGTQIDDLLQTMRERT